MTSTPARARLRSRSDAEILADQQRLHPDNTKHCPGCGHVLPLSEFQGYRRQNDGLQPQCRSCSKERYLRTHPEAQR